MRKTILLLIFTLGHVLSGAGQTETAILKKYFDAIGGEEPLSDLVAIKSVSYVRYSTNSLTNISTPFEKTDSLRRVTIVKKPVFSFTQHFDVLGHLTTSFYFNDQHCSYVSHTGFEDERYEISAQQIWQFPHEALFLQYQSIVKQIVLLPDTSINGVEYHRLKSPGYSQGYNWIYHFDKTTGLLLESHTDVNPHVVSFFLRYRQVDRIKFPFTIRSYRDGILYSENNIVSVEILNNVPPNTLFFPH